MAKDLSQAHFMALRKYKTVGFLLKPLWFLTSYYVFEDCGISYLSFETLDLYFNIERQHIIINILYFLFFKLALNKVLYHCVSTIIDSITDECGALLTTYISSVMMLCFLLCHTNSYIIPQGGDKMWWVQRGKLCKKYEENNVKTL